MDNKKDNRYYLEKILTDLKFIIDHTKDKTLEEIYKERPELMGITPEQGYIYNEYKHRDSISRYVR